MNWNLELAVDGFFRFNGATFISGTIERCEIHNHQNSFVGW